MEVMSGYEQLADAETPKQLTDDDAETPKQCANDDAETPKQCANDDAETPKQCANDDAETPKQCANADAETPKQCANADAETPKQCANDDAETPRQLADNDAETPKQLTDDDAETPKQWANTDAETPKQWANTDAETPKQCANADAGALKWIINAVTGAHKQLSDAFAGAPKRLADAVKAKSTAVKPQKGPLDVYKVPLKEKQINIKGCKHLSFGKGSTKHKHNRTIMVLGATGAGKSTLINGMINYILGVGWEDSFRFKLVEEGESKSQAESQTSEVTVYKIHHQEGFKIDHSLTIVDTPGFGDTRGIVRDREITEQIRNLFSDKHGVSEIDAICFVAQAALARLTPSQKYVFDSVLSIFGKDVAENIRILVTFADGQQPPVLEAINVSGVPCPKTKGGLPVHFKFNNSALFADNKSPAADSMSDEDEDGGFDKMFWNMGTKSMKKFFVALNVIETKSLTMTKEVLKERQQLENSIENLQLRVKVGLNKLEEIKATAAVVKDHEAEISRNEEFEIEVTVTECFQEDISGTGIFITNCQQCHFTCHRSCAYANDADKIYCGAMGPDHYCTQCPGKCFWNVHFNQKYRWDYRQVTKKQTLDDLKNKYLEATKAKVSVEEMFEGMRKEYERIQVEVVNLMERSSKCLNRLKEIALKPNPLSTPEYIDLLIEGEKTEAKSGWKQRVDYLIAMREKAELLAKVGKGEKLLQRQESQN